MRQRSAKAQLWTNLQKTGKIHTHVAPHAFSMVLCCQQHAYHADCCGLGEIPGCPVCRARIGWPPSEAPGNPSLCGILQDQCAAVISPSILHRLRVWSFERRWCGAHTTSPLTCGMLASRWVCGEIIQFTAVSTNAFFLVTSAPKLIARRLQDAAASHRRNAGPQCPLLVFRCCHSLRPAGHWRCTASHSWLVLLQVSLLTLLLAGSSETDCTRSSCVSEPAGVDRAPAPVLVLGYHWFAGESHSHFCDAQCLARLSQSCHFALLPRIPSQFFSDSRAFSNGYPYRQDLRGSHAARGCWRECVLSSQQRTSSVVLVATTGCF